MKSRRRRRHGTLHPRIDGLVPLQILLRPRPVPLPLDVGRQRRPPEPGEKIIERDLRPEFQKPLLLRQPPDDPRLAAVGERDRRSDLDPFGRTEQDLPGLPGQSPGLSRQQEDFDQAAGLLPADQARRKNTGVVDDDDIPFAEVLRKIPECPDLDTPRLSGAPPSSGTGPGPPPVPGRSALPADRMRILPASYQDQAPVLAKSAAHNQKR